MSTSTQTRRFRYGRSIPAIALGLAAGLTITLSPVPAFAQNKKAPAATKELKETAAPRSEAAALKEFKTEMAALKKWSQAQEAKAAEDPLIGLKMIKEMSSRLEKVRTDGLPDDLAKGYKDMADVVAKMADLFKEVPEGEAEFMEWAQTKFADQEFGEQMEKLGAEAKASGEKLKKIAKTHGIEDLDFDSKSGAEEAEPDGDDAASDDDDDDASSAKKKKPAPKPADEDSEEETEEEK